MNAQRLAQAVMGQDVGVAGIAQVPQITGTFANAGVRSHAPKSVAEDTAVQLVALDLQNEVNSLEVRTELNQRRLTATRRRRG